MVGLALLIVPFLIALEGLVLQKLWGWFIVPGFGVDEISIPMALGIAVTAKMLTHQDTASPDDDEPMVAVLRGLFRPVISLAFGYLLTFFI